jgi:hypothetical protein
MEMKVFKLAGIAASLLCSASAIRAQNLVTPGQLAKTAILAKSSLDTGVETATPVVPKQNIAYVETPHEKRIRLIWLTSIAAMTAGTAADAYSSWHKQESNSLLASSNGTFGAKGVTIKAGIGAAVLVPQIIFRRRHDWHTAFAISNFAEAGIFAGVTAHNLTVNK